MLRISPPTGSAAFGYIYLAGAELRHQDAITAYFDSAGREVTVLPCPDFDSFLAKTSLMYRNVLFITSLARYIIPAGIRILEANTYIASPHLDWLPNPPNLSSFQPSSRSTGTSGLLLCSTPAPSYHTKTLLSDVARTQTELTPTLCNTPIPAPPSRTSTWGGIWLVKAAVIQGCPH